LDKGGTFWSFSLARYEGDDWKGEISGWGDENQVTVEDSGLCDILEAESQGLAMVRAAAGRAAKVYKEQAKREQTQKEQINKECDKQAKRRADPKETANTQQEEWTKSNQFNQANTLKMRLLMSMTDLRSIILGHSGVSGLNHKHFVL